jgi:transposase-like protein
MLNSGKNIDEISKILGIGRNVLYTWRSKSQMNRNAEADKTKTSEEQTTYSLKLISENELLKKENIRLQSQRDILKSIGSLQHVQLRDIYERSAAAVDNIILKGIFS